MKIVLTACFIVVFLCGQLFGSAPEPSVNTTFTQTEMLASGDEGEREPGIAPTFHSAWDGVPTVPADLPAAMPFASESRAGLQNQATSLPRWLLASQVSNAPPVQLAPTQNLVIPEPNSSGGILMDASDLELIETVPAGVAFDSSSDMEATGFPVRESWIAPTATAQSNAEPSWTRSLLKAPRNLLRRQMGCDIGIGHERVMYAPMVLDTAVGTSNFTTRLQMDRGLETPDRLEYWWARPGRGPAPESRVDFFDTVFRLEAGNEKVLALTQYTMRSVNPNVNDNTTGFGDMIVGAKATLMDGRCTTLSSVFKTYLKTGPTDRGLGTGHLSLEPGFLLRHQVNEHTFFHGEIKYWLPIAGTPGFAGDVLRTGAGISTVWRETDTFALLPTVELVTYSFLAGAATDSLGLTRRVNGEFAAELYPGLRMVLGPRREFGLLELGFAPGIMMADRGWFDTRLNLELRVVK